MQEDTGESREENREIKKFVDFVGGPTKAGKILGCGPEMVRMLRKGERGFKPDHVRAMYKTKGYRLSFLRLFDLD